MNKNIKSGQCYSGLNQDKLGSQYASKEWGTYRQMAELGRQVKKGQKGTKITYCQMKNHKKTFRSIALFNIEQTELLAA